MIHRDPALHRMQLLLGPEPLAQLAKTRVLLVGLGGVGSWCAEALVRSGVGHLHLVDFDRVQPSNLNRQLQATTRTVGHAKTAALQARLRDVMPGAHIDATEAMYTPEAAHRFDYNDYDYVIDAIDSIPNKAHLIAQTLTSRATLFSAMGAAGKRDPTQVRTGPFWKVQGCPLARHLRKALRQQHITRAFSCVYSEEPRAQAVTAHRDPDDDSHDNHAPAATGYINGSAVQITGTFGLFLAALVVNDVTRRATSPLAAPATAPQ